MSRRLELKSARADLMSHVSIARSVAWSSKGDFCGLIGRSEAMRSVYDRIQRFARAPIPVLLLGETGTGKELAARAIWQIAGESQPFVALNCSAIPSELVESRVFGHERGAFTGAIQSQRGILDEADGGILFLDEVADLSPAAQAKLLRALETGEYRPLGARVPLRSEFRLLMATNRDLRDLSTRGAFRDDLLYRLGAARIVMPPLRERREDIPALAQEFVRAFRAKRGDVGPARVSKGAVTLLSQRDWPGNVRELKNVVEAAATVAEGQSVLARDLVEFTAASVCPRASDAQDLSLLDAVHRAEIKAIGRALDAAHGNREQAARLLGISTATLRRRLASLKGAPHTAQI